MTRLLLTTAKRLLILLTVSVYFFSASVAAAPTPKEDVEAVYFDTTFYDPNAQPACGAIGADGSTVTSLSGGDNPQIVFNFFTNNGFTAIQAAGIIGNMQAESGVNPLIYQGDQKNYQVPPRSGPGWGLVQWTPNTKITDYAKSVNKPAYEISTQMEFLLKQLLGTAPSSNEKRAGDDLKSTTTIEDAVRAFQGDRKIGGRFNGFERPADERGSLADRIGAAKLVFDKYSASVGTSTASTTPLATGSGCADGSGAVKGSVIQTALNYAWPDYHPAPYTIFKDSYRAAIIKAQANREYVGGGSKPGIDCGGFVTRVMRDSGADPTYNWGPGSGKEGNTDVQKAYLDAHPDKYDNLGPKNNTADLRPGDIAINGSHTYMYVGKQPGFNGNSASASYSSTGESWRTPMASNTYWGGGGQPFIWYRLK